MRITISSVIKRAHPTHPVSSVCDFLRLCFQTSIGFAVFVVGWLPPPVTADDMPLTMVEESTTVASTVWFDIGINEDESNDFALDVNLGTDSGFNWLLGASRADVTAYTLDLERDAQSNVVVVETRSDFTVENFRLGVVTSGTGPVQGGGELEYWGSKDELETRTLRLNLDIEVGDWAIGFQPEYREIEFFTRINESQSQPRGLQETSQALGVSVAYYGFSNIDLSVYASDVSYSRDPRVFGVTVADLFDTSITATMRRRLLRRYLVLRNIARNALTLSSGLVDRSIRVSAGYWFTNNNISSTLEQFESAVDASLTRVLSVRATSYVWDPWAFAIEIGQLSTDANSRDSDFGDFGDNFTNADAIYGRLSLGYRW